MSNMSGVDVRGFENKLLIEPNNHGTKEYLKEYTR